MWLQIHGGSKLKELKCNIDFCKNCFNKKNSRKDVSLPQQLQRAMAAEAEASREARAKVIAAEGEMKASRALKEAADVMTESPAALQVIIFRNERFYFVYFFS